MKSRYQKKVLFIHGEVLYALKNGGYLSAFALRKYGYVGFVTSNASQSFFFNASLIHMAHEHFDTYKHIHMHTAFSESRLRCFQYRQGCRRTTRSVHGRVRARARARDRDRRRDRDRDRDRVRDRDRRRDRDRDRDHRDRRRDRDRDRDRDRRRFLYIKADRQVVRCSYDVSILPSPIVLFSS